jgi:hypothetical protein
MHRKKTHDNLIESASPVAPALQRPPPNNNSFPPCSQSQRPEGAFDESEPNLLEEGDFERRRSIQDTRRVHSAYARSVSRSS